MNSPMGHGAFLNAHVSSLSFDYSIIYLNTISRETPPSSSALKDQVYKHLARIGKALSAPKRLELLDLLCEGPRTVEALAKHASLSVANASRHLRILNSARLVEAEKRGLFVHYRLADGTVERYLYATQALAEARFTEIDDIVERYLRRRGSLESVSGEELARRVRSGRVTVLDVRPAEEYAAAHLPGARSIPLKELQSRLCDLPKDREVVAYCRGRYCVLALEAVRLLRRAGYRAHRLEYGVRDWRARGWRVASAADSNRRKGKWP